MSVGGIVGGIVGGVAALIFIIVCLCGIMTVREKEVVIVERLGTFSRILTAGVHFVLPCIDRPVRYPVRYYVEKGSNRVLVERNDYRISLQNEVLDFPSQVVISKDNASLHLDVLLSYSLISGAAARTMVYSVANLPMVLSKLIQAHMRNVAATLEVDQLIENSAAMNVLTQLMNETTMRWGVKVLFVKVQKVEVPGLINDLNKKKNADLTNKDTIIRAKGAKQTEVLNAEGQRDRQVKTAEGQANSSLSKATGAAAAVVNAARAEADALQKILPVLQARGEDPVRYVLRQRYIEMLDHAFGKAAVRAYNPASSDAMIANGMGMNRIYYAKNE